MPSNHRLVHVVVVVVVVGVVVVVVVRLLRVESRNLSGSGSLTLPI